MKTVCLLLLSLQACSLMAPDSSYFSGGLSRSPEAGVDAGGGGSGQPTVEASPLPPPVDVTTLPETPPEAEVAAPEDVTEPVDTYEAAAADMGPDTKYLDRLPYIGPYRFNFDIETTRWEVTTGDCVISWDATHGHTAAGSMKLLVPPQPDGTVTRCELQLILPALTSFPLQVVHFWATKETPDGIDNPIGIKPFTLRLLSKQWADNGTHETTMDGLWTDYPMDLDVAPYRSSDLKVLGYDISTTLGGTLYIDDFAIVPKE